jgi:hypothetical protein
MVELITRRSMPPEWSEISWRARPLYVAEYNAPRLRRLEDGRVIQEMRRTRVLVVVEDGEPKAYPYDLGPPTDEPPLAIPCAWGYDDIGYINELLEATKELHKRLQERANLVEPIRTKAMREAVQAELERAVRENRGEKNFLVQGLNDGEASQDR